MTELCQYHKVCSKHERETYLCNNSESNRQKLCTAYLDLYRNHDLSKYNKEAKRKSLFDKIFGVKE